LLEVEVGFGCEVVGGGGLPPPPPPPPPPLEARGEIWGRPGKYVLRMFLKHKSATAAAGWVTEYSRYGDRCSGREALRQSPSQSLRCAVSTGFVVRGGDLGVFTSRSSLQARTRAISALARHMADAVGRPHVNVGKRDTSAWCAVGTQEADSRARVAVGDISVPVLRDSCQVSQLYPAHD
jgi:hypothetical protein